MKKNYLKLSNPYIFARVHFYLTIILPTSDSKINSIGPIYFYVHLIKLIKDKSFFVYFKFSCVFKANRKENACSQCYESFNVKLCYNIIWITTNTS